MWEDGQHRTLALSARSKNRHSYRKVTIDDLREAQRQVLTASDVRKAAIAAIAAVGKS